METFYNCTQLYQFMKEILWFCPALLNKTIKYGIVVQASHWRRTTSHCFFLTSPFIKKPFHDEFNSNHFDAVRGTDSYNLTIVNALQSDSGTYYCAFSFSNIIKFGNGTHLVIKVSQCMSP